MFAPASISHNRNTVNSIKRPRQGLLSHQGRRSKEVLLLIGFKGDLPLNPRQYLAILQDEKSD
jgi:hypothetical protein